MEKSQSQIAKQRRTRGPFNPSALDATRRSVIPSESRRRATMGPGDFMQTRQPKVLSHQTSGISKITDTESHDLELKLLYDEYLQGLITVNIIQKKTEERKNLLISQLATVAKESEQDEEKLLKLKERERDIINLTKIQDELDKQLIQVNTSMEDNLKKPLNDTLSQLHTALESLDILHCENIVLPETSKEWDIMQESLKKTADTLEHIIEFIGGKMNTYKDVNEGLKHLLKEHSEIENIKKKLEEILCDSQALVLKIASLSLSQN